MRDIPDWELQSWESATKYGKKVVVELREPFKEPIIKKNIDFFEAMRLTKGFALMHIEESAHKITFEYDKKDDTQDCLDELKNSDILGVYSSLDKAREFIDSSVIVMRTDFFKCSVNT